jgi:hypothetical protein
MRYASAAAAGSMGALQESTGHVARGKRSRRGDALARSSALGDDVALLREKGGT